MKRWSRTLSALLLFALPAAADVSFIALGDPQPGMGCPEDSQPWARYAGLTQSECISMQMNQLHEILRIAEERGVDFVWSLGDNFHNWSRPEQRRAMREEIDHHPDLTFHWNAGNHDIRTNSCSGIVQYALDNFSRGTSDPRPYWEAWQIDGHYFMGFTSSFWSFDLRACLHMEEDKTCRNASLRGSGMACTAAASGRFGTGTCPVGEACVDAEGYAIAQMAALGAWVDAAAADPNFKSFTTASHVKPWFNRNAQGGKQGPWTAIHNSRQCNDGDLASRPYDLCSDANIPGNDCDRIERANPGTCAKQTSVPGYDWRNQLEAHVARLPEGAIYYHHSGHEHQNHDCARTPRNCGTTRDDGVEYAFYVTLGTARPAQNAAIDEGGHEDNFLSARFVRIADDGTLTQHLIAPSDPRTNGDGKAANRK